MYSEILNLQIEEDRIRREADAWYDRWKRAMPKHGKEDDYWMHIAKITNEFSEKYGRYGAYLMCSRYDLLEKEWRALNGRF